MARTYLVNDALDPIADGTIGASDLGAAAIAAAVLDDLSDVTETSITLGDLLRWNGSAWVNYADSNYATSGHNHDAAYEALGAVSTHAGLSDPHTGYFLADGSRDITGSITLDADGTHDVFEDLVRPATIYTDDLDASGTVYAGTDLVTRQQSTMGGELWMWGGTSGTALNGETVGAIRWGGQYSGTDYSNATIGAGVWGDWSASNRGLYMYFEVTDTGQTVAHRYVMGKDFYSDTDAHSDLGRSGDRWANAYFSGTVYAGGVENASGSVTLTASNDVIVASADDFISDAAGANFFRKSGAQPSVYFDRLGGATSSGENLGFIYFRGIESDGTTQEEGAAIAGRATETWGTANVGTRLRLFASSTGGTSLDTEVTLNGDALYPVTSGLDVGSTGAPWVDAYFSGTVNAGDATIKHASDGNQAVLRLDRNDTTESAYDPLGTISFRDNGGSSRVQLAATFGNATNNGIMQFKVHNGTALQAYWDINSAGALRGNGRDICSSGGELAALYTESVAFPSTQVPSAGANVLDDYEEGNGGWTPTLTFDTAGDLSVAYSSQAGSYRKVGSLVHVQFVVTTTTWTHTTASGALRIGGLPFTIASTTDRPLGSLVLSAYTNAYTDDWFVLRGATGTTYINGRGTPSDVALVTAHLPTGTTFTLRGSLTYYV